MEIPAGATPLMRQYFEFKQQYSNTLLLFQVGDFYELFCEDAEQASQYLGIALTKRGKLNGEPIPLCGVPLHALEHYLIKLIKGGFRVAICDQIEDATPGSLVTRGVTQVLTPGTLTDSRLLPDKSSYLSSLAIADGVAGLVSAELLAGQLLVTSIASSDERLLEEELLRLSPQEVLVSSTKNSSGSSVVERLGLAISVVDATQEFSTFDQWLSANFLPAQVARATKAKAVYNALYQLFSFFTKNQPAALEQFKTLSLYSPEQYMMLDAPTQKNLELVTNLQDGTRATTLFGHLDRAITPMGSRVLRSWVVRPLMMADRIAARHEVLEYLIARPAVLEELKKLFAQLSDLERIVGRIALQRAKIGDYISLTHVLALIPHIKKELSTIEVPLIAKLAGQLGEYQALYGLLASALDDDRSAVYKIRAEFDQQLDELRDLVEHGNQKILALEKQEQQATGINSLKIRYNRIQGYYIEITKANLAQVPDYFEHHQTLVGKTRFMTPALKELESNLLKAEREIAQVEQQVYDRVTAEVKPHCTALRATASALATVDALLGLSLVAYEHGYVRPTMHTGKDININKGKHPVISAMMRSGFIPNNTTLTDEQNLWLITGPNMGGKSTYLRQVALTSIMAQMGSFVAAESAELPVLDRIFTRIGAGDNLAEGKSTFLVEMEETAAICSRATEKSLVILDEVGRGTSTVDGLAIAQSVVEYINGVLKTRCLFATHYHELTELAEAHPGIACYHAVSRKSDKGILFLHTIEPGTADGSFGLDVAELAGLPAPVIERAKEISAELLAQAGTMPGAGSATSSADQAVLRAEVAQLKIQLQQAEDKLTALNSINYDDLSPKKAFDVLWDLK